MSEAPGALATEAVVTAAQPALARGIGGAGFFALAFGTMVGSAWMVLLGDWISPIGPGGAVVAFLLVTLLIVPLAAAYSEMVARVPRAGAEFVYVEHGIGPAWGFVTGWFLTLYFVAIAAYEGLALAWFLENLFPALGGMAPLYTLLGKPQTLVDLLVGLSGVAVMVALNASGTTIAVGFQRIVTFGFIIASACLILLGFAQGDVANWQPLFEGVQERSFAGGLFAMSATAAMWLSGFQTAASAVEERAPGTSLHTIARAMMGAVVAGACFYCLIILAASALIPWHAMTTGALPVAVAFDNALPHGLATKAIILVAMASLAKTWNAMVLSASRVILAQARAGFLPEGLARIDPRTGAPRRAIYLVGACSIVGVLMGRGAIGPIIGMGTICMTIIPVIALVALYRMRRRPAGGTPDLVNSGGTPEFVMPGGTIALFAVAIGAAIVAIAAMIEPFGRSAGLPLEYAMMAAWIAIGAAMVAARRAAARRARAAPALTG